MKGIFLIIYSALAFTQVAVSGYSSALNDASGGARHELTPLKLNLSGQGLTNGIKPHKSTVAEESEKAPDDSEYSDGDLRDVWIITAKPIVILFAGRGNLQWTQAGAGLELERFYNKHFYRLGLNQFTRELSKDDRCIYYLFEGAADNISCVDLVPQSSTSYYFEIGRKFLWRNFALSYSGGLELNRYDQSVRFETETAVRTSADISYRFRNLLISAGLTGSISSDTQLWGGQLGLSLVY